MKRQAASALASGQGRTLKTTMHGRMKRRVALVPASGQSRASETTMHGKMKRRAALALASGQSRASETTMHGRMKRRAVLALASSQGRASETTIHGGMKRRAALTLALLLALPLALLPRPAPAYEPEIHQKLTFLAAKQFNRCVADTDLPGLNALQVRIVAKANARQADLNFFVRIFRWNYYDRSGVGDRDILWVIDTRFHEHFDQLLRRVAAAADAHDRYQNVGRIIGYIQDVSSPAHAVPVYASRWWRLSTKDRFDRYPVDEERLAETVAGRCDQALALPRPVLQAAYGDASAPAQSPGPPATRPADQAAGAATGAAAVAGKARAAEQEATEPTAATEQGAVAEQGTAGEQVAEAERSAWQDAGVAGYQALLEAAARETLEAVRAPMIGLPATWEVFWTPDEDPGSFGAYGPAGNNFGRGARFPCGLSEQCELLRDDPLYAAFALERHAAAVLRTMQALAIAQGQAIAKQAIAKDQAVVQGQVIAQNRAIAKGQASAQGQAVAKDRASAQGRAVAKDQAIAQGQAIQYATQRLAEHAD